MTPDYDENEDVMQSENEDVCICGKKRFGHCKPGCKCLNCRHTHPRRRDFYPRPVAEMEGEENDT